MPKAPKRVYKTTDDRYVLEGDFDAAFLAYGENADVPDAVLKELKLKAADLEDAPKGAGPKDDLDLVPPETGKSSAAVTAEVDAGMDEAQADEPNIIVARARTRGEDVDVQVDKATQERRDEAVKAALPAENK